MTHTRLSAAVLIALLAVLGCRENPIIEEPNKVPEADARVIWRDMVLDETIDAGPEGLMFEFDGTTPVEITLDGSLSTDEDGKIATYRWLSGMVAEGAPPEERRMVPNGDGAWPPDEMKPKVTFTAAGVYSFTLWVIDDKGAKSTPDTIKITVGNAVDPAVAQCVAAVVPTVPAACSECLCGIDDTCRAAAAATACNEACWTFIRCLGEKCPNFRAMAAMMDFSCLMANCSAEYAAGSMGATPVGTCIAMCPDECRSMPTMM